MTILMPPQVGGQSAGLQQSAADAQGKGPATQTPNKRPSDADKKRTAARKSPPIDDSASPPKSESSAANIPADVSTNMATNVSTELVPQPLPTAAQAPLPAGAIMLPAGATLLMQPL